MKITIVELHRKIINGKVEFAAAMFGIPFSVMDLSDDKWWKPVVKSLTLKSLLQCLNNSGRMLKFRDSATKTIYELC